MKRKKLPEPKLIPSVVPLLVVLWPVAILFGSHACNPRAELDAGRPEVLN